jgi:glycosyltransferase involved in cell wall biosynthesis
MALRLLIAGATSKFFHLKEFGEAVSRHGIEYKLVGNLEMYSNFSYSRVWYIESLLNYASLIPTPGKFRKTIEEFKPDVIFTDTQSYFGFLAIRSGIPLQLHLRGNYWKELQWAKETLYTTLPRRFAIWWKNKISEKCFRDCSAILPICKHLADVVREHYPSKNVQVLYQGIRPDLWYEEGAMDLKHPCVGLLQDANIWGKTVEMLLLTKVMKSMPDVHFYWVGGGPYQDYVLPELKKADNFTWLGKLPYPDGVRKFLGAIDVYALISGIDMAPLTLLEAELMQRPVVATRVGGIPELMADDKTGYLVDKGEPAQITEKLSDLLGDGKKARQMGRAGRDFVKENFSWDKVARDYVSFLESKL